MSNHAALEILGVHLIVSHIEMSDSGMAGVITCNGKLPTALMADRAHSARLWQWQGEVGSDDFRSRCVIGDARVINEKIERGETTTKYRVAFVPGGVQEL